MKNAALSRALKWLFIAQLLSIAALLPLVYDLRSLLGAAAGLLTLAALVRAAREASGYRAALVLQVAGLVLSALSYSFTRFFTPWILGAAAARWTGLDSSRAVILLMVMRMSSFFFSIILLVLGLLVLLLVCLTTAGLVDDPSLAARGGWAWRVNLICTVAVLVLTAVTLALSMGILDMDMNMEKLLGLSTAVTLLSAAVQLAGRVVYLRFLWQSARRLSAPDGSGQRRERRGPV